MSKHIDTLIRHDIEDLFTVVGTKDEEFEKLDAIPYSYWRSTFKRLFKNPIAIICIVLLVILLFFTIFGPIMKSYHIYERGGNLFEYPYGDPRFSGVHYHGPSEISWFGIGGAGMGYFAGLDLWSLVWEGTRFSLILATTVALIDIVLGIVIGAAWGYFRWLDPIMIEIRNFISNVPSLLLYILLMNFLPRSFWTIVFVLCLFGWLGLASFIRNQIIIIRNREYNIASQTLGSSPVAMITHNLLPYLVSVIVTVVSTSIPAGISAEVGLAFFGLSFQPMQQVTLGQILTSATSDVNWTKHPYILIAPLIVMVPLTVAFFYLGLALSDATDPKTHR
ncbi:MAG: ABC transporter permease [Erysipelotrichaceae bacterium]|jgi:oligopeptide transport system permease protein|nr:ABC transporter permease [Bacillota bacterium]MDY0118034.1 ABC transporter permease [Bacilli bacterium]NLJ32318.1 ABC transporter permease [Erysipelotrichaceae bacterium]